MRRSGAEPRGAARHRESPKQKTSEKRRHAKRKRSTTTREVATAEASAKVLGIRDLFASSDHSGNCEITPREAESRIGAGFNGE